MAALTPYETFLPLILPYARGCPKPTAVAMLRDATIDFCKRSRVWQELLDPPLDVTAGSREVEVLLPDQTELISVLHAWYQRQPLSPMTDDALRAANIKPWDEGVPQFFKFSDLFVIELAPIPKLSVASGLDVRCSLHPAVDSDSMPEPIYRKYHEVVRDGALARLMRLPDEWAVKAAAVARSSGIDYQASFEAQCAMVGHRVAQANTTIRRRVHAAYF